MRKQRLGISTNMKGLLKKVTNDRKELTRVKMEQENTLASIHYARKIQDAILINREELKTIFTNFSIVYEPKDIVSGDFYYAEKRGNQNYLVVSDCTGHGVPGAFLSILCNDLLVRAMKKVSMPSEILHRTDELLVERLNQGREDGISDAMDVGIALIDYDKMTINYSSARNDGVLLRASGEVDVLKATRISLGKSGTGKNDKKFIERELTFSKGDFLYLFTDGYRDQFNDADEKMGKRKFMEILSELYFLPIDKQEKKLNEIFKKYKGNSMQMDDVLVLGVQL